MTDWAAVELSNLYFDSTEREYLRPRGGTRLPSYEPQEWWPTQTDVDDLNRKLRERGEAGEWRLIGE